ncbi:ATP-binding cassette domain-containing protein [Gynuella sp.]|uniref:ATP-binding cassette domain-containing protein n=1 Tax=Gynuella sp. TaxID=2969146 RepID=UPI003D0A1D80
MIEIHELCKNYEVNYRDGFFRSRKVKKSALRNISLAFDSPEIIGLVGNNGAGKTTLMKLICGLLYPSSGKISILGEDPFKKNKSLLSNIAFLSGRKDSLSWDLPVCDSFKLHGYIYGLEKRSCISQYEKLADLFSATDLLQKQARALSLGERMKCELIKSLLHKPRILLLDEPTIGLDLETQLTFRKYIRLVNEEEKSLILLSSHNMEDISHTCSRMVGLSEGEVVFNDFLSEIVNNRSPDSQYRICYENNTDETLHEIICDMSDIPEELNKLRKNHQIRVISIRQEEKTFSQSIMNIISTKNLDHA